MKLLVVDSRSVVGFTVALCLEERGHEVNRFDELHDIKSLQETIENGFYDAVVNCSAIVNQDAENDQAEAAFINVFIPHYLEKITKQTKTVIVHRSTDCIFSGKKGQYTIDDTPDAQSFYARTKAVGELNNNKDISIRVSLIGPDINPKGGSLLNWYLNQKGDVNGFANAIWTGITTIEYAREIELLLAAGAHGVFQSAPSESISKYELIQLFEKYFPANRHIIKVDNTKVDKSLIPYYGDTGIEAPDYDTQIKEMRKWIDKHPDLFPSYYYDNRNK